MYGRHDSARLQGKSVALDMTSLGRAAESWKDRGKR
jgi:hypothetical protein